MVFFSVIIPTYNRAHLIRETLQSIINQTYKNWECIVIDDGSTDNTRDVFYEIINNDNRIKYFFQSNAERSAARNNGIKHAKGKYICFLDSDDVYLENHLQIIYEEIVKQNFSVGMFFTNQLLCQDGRVVESITPSLGENQLEYLFINPIIPARVAIHKNILKEFTFDEDIVIVEDLILWLKIHSKFPLFHIEKETIIYNLHEDNSVNLKNNSFQKRLQGLILFKKRYPEIVKKIPNIYLNGVIGGTHFNIMKYYIYKHEKWKAIKHLLMAIYFQKNHSQFKHKIYVLLRLTFNKKINEYSNEK
jgi:glycosyltransferase involved in cell wall biosynthesis